MSLIYVTSSEDVVGLAEIIAMYPEEWNAAVVDICCWNESLNNQFWHIVDYISEITDVFEELICSKELDEQLAKYDTDALSEEEIEDLIDSLSISHYLDGEIDYKDIIIAFSHVDALQ